MKLFIAIIAFLSLSILTGCATEGGNSNHERHVSHRTMPETSAPQYHQPEAPATEASKMLSPLM